MKLIASLAPARAEIEVVAKADQQNCLVMTLQYEIKLPFGD